MKIFISAVLFTFVLGTLAFAQSSSPYSNPSMSMQQITNGPVAETVADSTALIGWSSKNPSSSDSLKYGTSRDRLTQTVEARQNSDSKNHHANLTGLSPDTTYYFQIMENGMPVGGIGTFRTVGSGEKPIQSKAVISQR